jgi:hypothetical protein
MAHIASNCMSGGKGREGKDRVMCCRRLVACHLVILRLLPIIVMDSRMSFFEQFALSGYCLLLVAQA